MDNVNYIRVDRYSGEPGKGVWERELLKAGSFAEAKHLVQHLAAQRPEYVGDKIRYVIVTETFGMEDVIG